MGHLYLVTAEVKTWQRGSSTTSIKSRLVRALNEEEAEEKFRKHFSTSDGMPSVFEVEVSAVIE
ncbi:hypothetical protein P5704_028215 (plasmid) [Pseudomonas sp. FeN3W]|nr:hypothetical protein P5704_028215 [Pseudomonas sp. FeN3W]